MDTASGSQGDTKIPTGGHYTYFYSKCHKGNIAKNSQGGVAIALKNELRNTVMSWEAVNYRIV